MTNSFLGKAAPLTQQGFNEVLKKIGGDAPSLWALLTVETCGFGFLPDRRPKILFERHIFHKRTKGRHSAVHPDISSSTSGGYKGGTAEYGRLEQAMKLDRQAALESVSWGLGQIMGFNAVSLGYPDTEDMVKKFVESEDEQLDGSRRFIAKNPTLESAYQNKNWTKVASLYNGPAFEKNHYHIKLAQFCELYTTQGTPSIDVRTAQANLTFLGFDPRGVDGVLGKATHAALSAFQKAQGLPATGDPDDTTMNALRTAASV